MALSNIFREPRREITETVIGVALIALPLIVFLSLDYWLAAWAHSYDPTTPILIFMVLGPPIIIAVLWLFALLLVLIHDLGESACDALDRRGVHLRPRQRPTR